MTYLVDANAIITPFSKPSLNALKLALGYSSTSEVVNWLRDWFTRAFENGYLVGAQELVTEVGRKKDLASQLLNSLMDREVIQLLRPKDETFGYLADIELFVRQHFNDHQADLFSQGNDGWYIALAMTHRVHLITLEGYNIPQCNLSTGRIQGKARMPFVAWVFGVTCIPLFQAFLEFH